MKNYVTVVIVHLLVVIFTLQAHAQQTDVGKEIFSYQDSNAAMISNGREHYAKKNVSNEKVPSNWGTGFEFFSGYSLFTDALREYYSATVPVGIAFDIQYKQYVLFLREFIGFSATKKDISYGSGIWPAHSQARVLLPEASLGYVVADHNWLKLAPFIGVASARVAPTGYDIQNNPSLSNAPMGFVMTYTLGINTDIKLGAPKKPKTVNQNEQSFWFARIRYGYNVTRFAQSYPGMTGNFHYITIGIGGFGRRIKSVQ